MSLIKNELESVYSQHHTKGKRYGYLYCGGARGHYLKKWIGQGKKVLDLGCRDGMLTAYYREGNEVEGVDIDRSALDLAEKSLSIQTHWLDLNSEWPFQAHSFDVIVACELLEHLFMLEPFLAKVASSLRDGGQFIGSVPNAFRMRNRVKFLCGEPYEKDPTHMRQFSYEQLEATLNKHFASIEIVPIQGRVFPFIPVSERLPKSLNRLFAKDLLFRTSTKS